MVPGLCVKGHSLIWYQENFPQGCLVWKVGTGLEGIKISRKSRVGNQRRGERKGLTFFS